MELGASSISLAVKDIAISKAFFEKFGFKAFHRDTTRLANFVAVDPDGNPFFVDQHI